MGILKSTREFKAPGAGNELTNEVRGGGRDSGVRRPGAGLGRPNFFFTKKIRGNLQFVQRIGNTKKLLVSQEVARDQHGNGGHVVCCCGYLGARGTHHSFCSWRCPAWFYEDFEYAVAKIEEGDLILSIMVDFVVLAIEGGKKTRSDVICCRPRGRCRFDRV